MRIKSIKARQIINGKGQPALQIEISTSRFTAVSSAPIAASKGKYEFRDAYDNHLTRFQKENLDRMVQNVNELVAPELEGKNTMDQEVLDRLLLTIDNTLDRSRLGVNAIAAISQTLAKLGAMESNLPLFKYIRVLHDFTGNPHTRHSSNYKLPKPVVTIYQAALHDVADRLPAQEVVVFPKSNFSYKKDLTNMFEALSRIDLNSERHNLKSFLEYAEKHVTSMKFKFLLGVDMAASRYERKHDDVYVIPNFHSNKIYWKGNSKKLLGVYLKWMQEYKLDFLEDVFGEDNYNAWNDLKRELLRIDHNIQIVSDDFTGTNIERLDKVSMLECCNNVVVKPSQIGTVTECVHFAQRANKFGSNITVGSRYGETEDTFISDLAVGINADFVRSGYYLGSEYNSKLNRLLQIEDEIG